MNRHPLDSSLLEVSHFEAFPAMLPFIGANYESPTHNKLLLVGESGFFPEESIIHKDPEAWYAAVQTKLSNTEIDYINCRALLNNLGHRMYQELARCLGELPLNHGDKPLSHVAYCNAFFRPAEDPGESFYHCSTPLDCGKSHEITAAVVRALQPDVVIYVSKFAWNASGQFVAKKFPEIQFDRTCHPMSSRHWNVESYPDGRKKFTKLLQELFLKSASESTELPA